jgi:hypothetical protein
MNITYDPTAKAEALSRLVGALRKEVETLTPYAQASTIIGARWETALAEIAILEEVTEIWLKLKANVDYGPCTPWQITLPCGTKVGAKDVWKQVPKPTLREKEEFAGELALVEKITSNEKAAGGRQGDGGTQAGVPQPFLTPDRRAAVERLVAGKIDHVDKKSVCGIEGTDSGGMDE